MTLTRGGPRHLDDAFRLPGYFTRVEGAHSHRHLNRRHLVLPLSGCPGFRLTGVEIKEREYFIVIGVIRVGCKLARDFHWQHWHSIIAPTLWLCTSPRFVLVVVPNSESCPRQLAREIWIEARGGSEDCPFSFGPSLGLRGLQIFYNTLWNPFT